MNIPKCLRKKFWNIYKNTLTELSNIYIALNVNWLFVINYQILDNGGKSEFKWVINLSLFFFFFSYDLLCHCVFVLKGRNDLINKKIKVWFWSYQCSLLSFGQIHWKSNGYYADLRGWANGGGGGQKAALQDWLVQANKADFLLWFWSFSWQRWSCLQPMPPPPPSLCYVFEASPYSFFYYSSIVLLKETP